MTESEQAARLWCDGVRRETAKALLCEIRDHECWIPISQISSPSEVRRVGDRGWLVIPRWLAERLQFTAAAPTTHLPLTTLTAIYHELALRWHPDRAGAGGHNIMLGINIFWDRIKAQAS